MLTISEKQAGLTLSHSFNVIKPKALYIWPLWSQEIKLDYRLYFSSKPISEHCLAWPFRTSQFQARFLVQENIFCIYQLAYQGPVAVDVLPENRTITGTCNVENTCTQSCPTDGRSASDVIIHHENVRPHKARAMIECLNEHVPVLSWSLCSPDIDSRYLVVPSPEGRTGCSQAFRRAAVPEQSSHVMKGSVQSEHSTDWLRRLALCVQHKGE